MLNTCTKNAAHMVLTFNTYYLYRYGVDHVLSKQVQDTILYMVTGIGVKKYKG